jgi:hypothetical protein
MLWAADAISALALQMTIFFSVSFVTEDSRSEDTGHRSEFLKAVYDYNTGRRNRYVSMQVFIRGGLHEKHAYVRLVEDWAIFCVLYA